MKNLHRLVAAAALLSLVACGDDSGSGTDAAQEEVLVIGSSDTGFPDYTESSSDGLVDPNAPDILSSSSLEESVGSSETELVQSSSGDGAESSSDENAAESSSSAVSSSSSSVDSAAEGYETVCPAGKTCTYEPTDFLKSSYENEIVNFGEFLDTRDYHVYKTVNINGQVWLAQNLNYNYNMGSAKSYCYDDDVKSCATWGRLYTWAAAMDSAGLFGESGRGCGNGVTCSPSGDVRGVCPEGWHLPRYYELDTLFRWSGAGGKSVSAIEYRTASLWKKEGDFAGNTNRQGFSAMPAGTRSVEGYYNSKGMETRFWTSTEYDESNANYGQMYYQYTSSLLWEEGKKGLASSVRCIKDGSYPGYVPSSSSEISSSSAEIVSSSSAEPVVGTLTDSRDNQTYKTVTIGTQTWMAENLNYDYVEGISETDAVAMEGRSFCYDDSDESCSTYGRLYTWAAAMDSLGLFGDKGKGCGTGAICSGSTSFGSTSSDSYVQGVCPTGWHLPSVGEWSTLITNAGEDASGIALKSSQLWNSSTPASAGTDAYEFSALPAGIRDSVGTFNAIGESAQFWSSSGASDGAWIGVMEDSSPKLFLSDRNGASALSIRCVKD